eukprot:3585351-Prymnesium_polylepis.1
MRAVSQGFLLGPPQLPGRQIKHPNRNEQLQPAQMARTRPRSFPRCPPTELCAARACSRLSSGIKQLAI